MGTKVRLFAACAMVAVAFIGCGGDEPVEGAGEAAGRALGSGSDEEPLVELTDTYYGEGDCSYPYEDPPELEGTDDNPCVEPAGEIDAVRLFGSAEHDDRGIDRIEIAMVEEGLAETDWRLTLFLRVDGSEEGFSCGPDGIDSFSEFTCTFTDDGLLVAEILEDASGPSFAQRFIDSGVYVEVEIDIADDVRQESKIDVGDALGEALFAEYPGE